MAAAAHRTGRRLAGIALIGPRGAGKSTLGRMLHRIDDHTALRLNELLSWNWKARSAKWEASGWYER